MAAAVSIWEVRPTPAASSAPAIDEVAKMERRIFPKHESMAAVLRDELRKKGAALLCASIAAGPPSEIVGYVIFSFPTSICASITKLAVKEDHRRKGYGESLLRAAVEECRRRRAHRVSLHVDPTRTAAVGLYRKLGFQVDSEIESYYSPGRNAYRMFLDLQ